MKSWMQPAALVLSALALGVSGFTLATRPHEVPTPTATPSAAPSWLDIVPLGQSLETPRSTTTVSKVQRVDGRITGAWAVYVKQCSKTATTVQASADGWAMTSGGRAYAVAAASGWADSDPKPRFTFPELSGGKCAEGWIVFATDEGVTPDQVRLQSFRKEVSSVAWKLT